MNQCAILTMWIIALFHLPGIFTARQRSCGKVVLSQVSVCYSVQEGGPCTIINMYTIHGFPLEWHLLPKTRDYSNLFIWGPPSDNWWRKLKTCSNLCSWGPICIGADIWWLKHVWWASERYTSCWNAFLFGGGGGGARISLVPATLKILNAPISFHFWSVCSGQSLCTFKPKIDRLIKFISLLKILCVLGG